MWFLPLGQGWELPTGLSAPTAGLPMPIAPFRLTDPGALSPASLRASFHQGLLIPIPTAGHFPAASGFGKLCPPSARGGISSTYLQRGGHGLAAAYGCADAQAPWDADGVRRHGEALQHHGVRPVTAVLPGKATNLRHQGTGGVRARVSLALGLQEVSPVLDPRPPPKHLLTNTARK